MALSVNKLTGMTEALQENLKARGITNSDELLKACATPALRKRLSVFAGVDSRTILELANRADLSRVKGVGSIYSDPTGGGWGGHGQGTRRPSTRQPASGDSWRLQGWLA